ncbi:MAG: HlyD family efflux transporter periplasmic adaptor subunit, partial [Caulobacteraceae bacterium]
FGSSATTAWFAVAHSPFWKKTSSTLAAVVALLPNDKIKLRFFVPERQINGYRPGAEVKFSCDGCQAGMTARVTYISPRPEFTPPVIYSRETRDRLVYLVEAKPSVLLNPGQPVDVQPIGPAG